FGWRVQAEERWAENDTRFLAFARGPAAEAEAPAHSPARAIASYFAGFRNRALAIAKALARDSSDLFLMPASVYTQALIAGGLDPKRFVALLDNAPIKQGARLCGTSLNVMNPSEGLCSAYRPVVVLNAGAHDAEIASGLRRISPNVAVLSAPAP